MLFEIGVAFGLFFILLLLFAIAMILLLRKGELLTVNRTYNVDSSLRHIKDISLDQGYIFSIDVSESEAERLTEIFKSHGLENVIVINKEIKSVVKRD